MSTQTVNRAQAAALKAMFGELLADLEADTGVDALIALEGVVLGTFMMVVRLGGDVPVFDVFADRMRERLAEQRLGPLSVLGGRQ